jgi:hypothetical protein
VIGHEGRIDLDSPQKSSDRALLVGHCEMTNAERVEIEARRMRLQEHCRFDGAQRFLPDEEAGQDVSA